MDCNVCMKETAAAFGQRRESLTTAAFSVFRLESQESHEHPHTASCIPERLAGLLMGTVQTEQLFSLVHLYL